MRAAWSWRTKANTGFGNTTLVIGDVLQKQHLNCRNPYTPRHTSHTVVVAAPG